MNIQNALLGLGFHSNEAKVFLALVEAGRGSAAEIARSVSLPRTTTYSILEALLKRGIIKMQVDARSRIFILEDPEALIGEIERERSKLNKREIIARTLSAELKPFLAKREISPPKMQFYEGSSAVESMLYSSSDKWQRSVMSDDGTWWGYQDPTFVEHYRGWLEDYWKAKKRDEKIFLISNITKTETTLKGKVQHRIIKPAPLGYKFSSTIWILGGEFIVMIMTQRRPHYAFQIRDRVFAQNLQMLFQMLWRVA